MIKKDYKDLKFIDDFIFCKILSTNPKLCKELIELILAIKIKDIKVSEMQMQGCRNRLWWDDDHKYYTCKPELLEREIESGKTISDNRTYSYL